MDKDSETKPNIIRHAGGNPEEFVACGKSSRFGRCALLKKQIEDERPKKAELRKKLNNLHGAARLIEGSL